MKRVISKDGALKAFYYLMAIDGDVSIELERFDEIGREFYKEGFDDVKQSIIDECQKQIESTLVDDELYDVIQEGLDVAINDTVNHKEEGVYPRLLIWDMLSLAFADSDFSDSEKRLISHVARVLEVEKDILMEMEHLMRTADAVLKELDILNQSNRPYSEIRPLVDEIEKRKQTITKAAEELIEDDIILDVPEHAKKDDDQNSFFSEAGKKISDSINPMADQVGVFAKKAFSDAKGALDKMPDSKEIKDGAGKLFSKMKGMISNDATFRFPSDYKLVKKNDSLGVGAPGSTWVFSKVTGNTEAEVFSVKVSSEESMNFDDRESLINELRQELDAASGLIEVTAGKAKNGGKFIYFIKKIANDLEIPSGNTYLLSLNVQVGGEIFFVLGAFKEIGITGTRDSLVYTMMLQGDTVKREKDGFIKGWARDPYDETFTKGFLMNMSEDEKYDKHFPDHPLSELRRLKDFILQNN